MTKSKCTCSNTELCPVAERIQASANALFDSWANKPSLPIIESKANKAIYKEYESANRQLKAHLKRVGL